MSISADAITENVKELNVLILKMRVFVDITKKVKPKLKTNTYNGVKYLN